MITLKLLDAEYQILTIAASPPNTFVQPADIANFTLPPELDLNREVILFGQMPMWVYGAVIDRCRTALWIGCYAALEKQAVVIHSQISTRAPGDVVPITLNRSPCPAILIGGPPDSGKSVLSNALRQSLLQQQPDRQVYLQQANWDGGGNWQHEAANRDLVNYLIREHERRVHEHPQATELLPAYFQYHAGGTANLRELVDLVLVDVGGKIQPEKQPLLEQCTHYIIISRSPDLVQPWHDFCSPTLKPIAVIHSVQEHRMEVLQTEPFLEILAGPWNRGEKVCVPDALLQHISECEKTKKPGATLP